MRDGLIATHYNTSSQAKAHCTWRG